MNSFATLFSVSLRNFLGLSVARDRYLRRKESLWQPPLVILGVIVGIAPLLWGYVKLLQSMYNVSVQLNQPGLVVMTGFTMVQLVVLFFGLFYLISIFYFSNDLELLVPLPLSPATILGSKLGLVLLSEYVTSLPIVIPPLVIYGMRQQVGLIFWPLAALVSLLLPLLPLALSGILVVLLMRFTRLARRPDTVRVIAAVASVAVILTVQLMLSNSVTNDPAELSRQIAAAPNSLLRMLGQRFPPALWGSLALVETGTAALRYLGAYLAVTAGAVALLWALARVYFFQGLLDAATQPVATKHRRRQSSLAPRPAWVALLHREWLSIVRHPIFAMTAGQALILPPLLLVIALFSGNSLPQLQQLSTLNLQPWGTLGVAALVALLPVMSSIPATAISREGALFWISQSIPVAGTTQLFSKIVFSLVATVASGIPVLMVLLYLNIPWPIILSGLALGVLLAITFSAISLGIDVFWPRLDWSNPQQAMKGNTNNLVALAACGGLGFLLAQIAIRTLRAGWSTTAVLGLETVIFAVLAVATTWALFRIGVTLYGNSGSGAETEKEEEKKMSFAEVLRRYGKSILTVIVVLVAGYFLGQQVWLGTTLEYKFDSDAVRFAKVELPYSEITDVQYLESIPALSNRVGTSFGKYRSGTFTVEGIGRGQLWAKDVSKPALLLRNAETFYIITPEDAQDKYQEVKTKVSETTR